MVKRKSPGGFFDVILPLPRDLTKICLEYCSYRYCDTCNDVFPVNFKCLSCPTLTGVVYYTGGFTEEGDEIKFDNFMDQLVWDYVQLKLPEGHSKIAVGWTGLHKLTHKLTLCVDRKRTRTNHEWWSIQFYPLFCLPRPCELISYKQTNWSSLGSNQSRWIKTIE